MAADRRTSPISRLPRVSLLAAALALATGAVQAQSLQELYDAARAYDATYLAARAVADSAQYRYGQAQALARPSVGLGIGATRNETDLPTVGTAAGPVNPGWQGSTTSNAGLSAKYAIFNRPNAGSIEQARLGVDVAQSDLATAEQDLIVRVAQAYFDVLAAKDTLSTSSANKAAIAEQLASAKRNFEVGTATITDTREAQARYDLATAQELAADNDLRVKRVTLDQLVGRAGVEPRPLAVPVALPPVAPSTVEPWVTQAEGGHPAIRKAQLGLDIAKIEIERAQGARYPTVDLNATLGVQRQTGEGVSYSGTAKTGTLGVSVNLPVYSGGAITNRIKETMALEEKSRNDLDFARRSVEEGTKRAFFGVQSLQAQVKAYEAAEASSKLALEATQLGYKVGVRVNLDVLNAQTQLYTTQRDLAKARYDVLVNSLKLRQASGQLRPEDVSAINTLLAR
ncbi:TolC family outer membrane protein [Mitsuaria sp. GD03876]|uniref:TolC family outer membrane protein n=1 Tax=Mitsuaria sp. GD03876 TaxID=2975399 RepID=UPI00244B6ECF|nr:TolC family outer membrane protein [Mitsuaria sp. GD03876]MDH0863884.1 TolC family outer membrane protein [Mitsuaria sp. GD03876]